MSQNAQWPHVAVDHGHPQTIPLSALTFCGVRNVALGKVRGLHPESSDISHLRRPIVVTPLFAGGLFGHHLMPFPAQLTRLVG